jgi:hypothetical protein
MFQIGDRVKLKSFPQYTGEIVHLEDPEYFIKFDSPNVTIPLWYNHKDVCGIEETTTMDNPFIETVTTQKIKAGHYNGDDINCASVWIKTARKKSIDLAVCLSEPSNIDYCAFNKKGLGNLLKMLQEVHDLMED